MQAFLWRHLVPAAKLTLNITNRGWCLLVPETDSISANHDSVIEVKWKNNAYKSKKHPNYQFELDSPPKGVILKTVTKQDKYYIAKIAIEKDAKKFKGSLIFKLFIESTKKSNKKKNRYMIGYLPAVKVEIR